VLARHKHLCDEAISTLVDGLNAFPGFQVSAQGRDALGNAVGRDVHISPKDLAQFVGSDDSAGAGNQKLQRREFLGRKVDGRIAAKERAVGLQAEASE
jgi:hypothetical protein